MSRPVIMPSQRTDWNTPKWIVDEVLRTFGGVIDLDPCSNSTSLIRAVREISLPEDGLAVPWEGNVYVNPPYGRKLDAWICKAWEDSQTHHANVLMLIPASPSRRAWQAYVRGPDCRVCFLQGRVRFLGAASGAAFGSALVLWSKNAYLQRWFQAVWGRHGFVMREVEP